MKNLVIRIAMGLTRLYLRHFPLYFGKEHVFRKICGRYINWRNIHLHSKTKFGAKMDCDIRDVIQQKIVYFGEWEPNLTDFLNRRLGPGDGFIDVGANIGYYSLLADKLVGKNGFVLSIEASPSIYSLLRENIRKNGATKVRAVNMAVAEREGTVTIYKADAENTGASSIIGGAGLVAEAEVRSAPLAGIATAEELKRARVIKIDIEGAEAPILREIIANIGLFHPAIEIVSEMSHDGGKGGAHEILNGFKALGFHAYELANDYTTIRAYVDRSSLQPPTRMDSIPSGQFDVVLSRLAAPAL